MKLTALIRRLIPRSKPRLKAFGSEIATEAFKHDGHTYYSFAENFKMPAGRAICALSIYAELQMRCTPEYIDLHIAATEKILNAGNGKIRLVDLAQINANLKERRNLAPFPDHIYKLASVIFFDETESPYGYDFTYNQKKIEAWKKDGELLYFFLNVPFKDLMPIGALSKEHAQNYLNTTVMIDQLHRSTLQGILSKKG